MIIQLNAQNHLHPDLSENEPYFVIGIEADDYRILNDAGKPYLYPARIFDILDRQEPPDWITEYGDDGERYSYPRPLNQPGFFEDFFDHKQDRISIFWHIVNRAMVKAA